MYLLLLLMLVVFGARQATAFNILPELTAAQCGTCVREESDAFICPQWHQLPCENGESLEVALQVEKSPEAPEEDAYLVYRAYRWSNEDGTDAELLAQSPCSCDCDGSGEVNIPEIIAGVNIALGLHTMEMCTGADGNGDRIVGIDELVLAVHSLMHGCPLPPEGMRIHLTEAMPAAEITVFVPGIIFPPDLSFPTHPCLDQFVHLYVDFLRVDGETQIREEGQSFFLPWCAPP